jgi:hypothetical protein
MPLHRLVGLVAILAGQALGTLMLPAGLFGEPTDKVAPTVDPVPPDLTDWKISIANVGLREPARGFRTGPAAEAASSGSLSVRMKKASEFSVPMQLTSEERDRFFLKMCAVVDGTHLTRPGRAYPLQHALHNPAIYEIRLAHGSRALRIELQDPQPSRIGLEDDLGEALAILNKQISRHGMENHFPKPTRLDEKYRDKLAGGLRERVPDELEEWSGVQIEMTSGTKRLRLQMRSNDATYAKKLTIESGQEKRVREFPNPEEREAFFQAARLILNEFTLSNEETPAVNNRVTFSIGMAAHDRSITVEFDDYAGLPSEWRRSVEKACELSGVKPLSQDSGSASDSK